VIAATNRPETLDPALLRPGRFDRQVEIHCPRRERAAILAVHSRDKHFADDVDLDAIARGTPGFSGADLANLVNEAAIVACGRTATPSRARTLPTRAIASCSGTATRPMRCCRGEARVAVHESGHALVATLSPTPIR